MHPGASEIQGNGKDDDGNGYVDDIHGYDFVNNDGDPRDDHNHGTHVAGTIGAIGDNTGAANTGAAYLFNSSTGALLQTFLNPTPEAGEAFGTVAPLGDNDPHVGELADVLKPHDAGFGFQRLTIRRRQGVRF